MANLLTHLFLPLLVVYVLRREMFSSPALLVVGGFGLLSDFDKFLGIPGLLHSLITIVPLSLGILGIEYWFRRQLHWSPLIVALIGSHLVLDVINGSPVPLLFPFSESGIALQYPMRVAFGEGPLGVSVSGPLVTMTSSVPRPGYNAYGFIDGFGVASLIAFMSIYVGQYR